MLNLELKKRREQLKVTQKDLAELSGVGLRTIKAIEANNANATIETIQKIALVLGLTLRLEIKH